MLEMFQDSCSKARHPGWREAWSRSVRVARWTP
jgi:hypothetical protein